MTLGEMERYKHNGAMHRHVVITKTDGSKVEGYLEPWSDEDIPIAPLDGHGAGGQAVIVKVGDIQDIDVRPLE